MLLLFLSAEQTHFDVQVWNPCRSYVLIDIMMDS